MASNLSNCELCQGAFDFHVTDIAANVVVRKLCRKHFQEFTIGLSRAHDTPSKDTDQRQFWLRAVVSGRYEEHQSYLELANGRFLNIAGGLCENGLLHYVALGSTPTIHRILPELFGIVSAQLIDTKLDSIDGRPDSARIRLETACGERHLAVRPTDAIAVGMIFNKPMYISESLNRKIEWGIKWGRINLPGRLQVVEHWDYLHGLERRIQATIDGILKSNQDYFAKHGISHGELRLRVESDELSNYTSFLSIPFSIGNKSLWSVDLPVIRKGRPVASINKLAMWFEKEIRFPQLTEDRDDTGDARADGAR